MAGLSIIVILVCMAGEAFFSGIETGIVSIHKMRLKHAVRNGLRGAKTLQEFLENSNRLFGTTLVGTNICVVVISVLSTALVSEVPGGWAEPVMSAVVTVLLLVFCEYLPKAWFHSRPLDRSRHFAGVLTYAEKLLRPISVAVIWLTHIIVKAPPALSRKAPFVTRDDLKSLVGEIEKGGTLTARERAMIHRVFALSEKSARDIMVPLSKMTFINKDATVDDFRKIARESNFTRIPVFDPAEKKFIGIVNLFFVVAAETGDGAKSIAEFIRKPLMINENMRVDDILPLVRRSRQPMCLVKNANEDVVGLITTEDILEEIVGQL